MDHCPEMVIAKLALAALGIPYIPLDPTYPSKRINYILENADTNYVLTNSHESVVYLGENTQIVFINQVISNSKKVKDIIATATERDLLYLTDSHRQYV